jgi:deoxyribodipyrimidine photo-lyase
MPTRIVWFRRDLRLADNPALAAAVAHGDVLPLFVLDERLLSSPRMGAPRLAYLVGALRALDRRLRRAGAPLVVRRGDPRALVPQLVRETAAAAVHCNADVTPYATGRDAEVAERLAATGVPLERSWGTLVHPPTAIRTGAGRPYRVFTPFFRTWRAEERTAPLPAPDDLSSPAVPSDPLPTLTDLTPLPWDGDLDAGEEAAGARLERFLAEGVETYESGRDRLAEPGTSILSADLKYGCLSARQVLDRLDRRRPGHEAFERQIAWRDFAAHVMHAWPEVATTELDHRALPWRQGGPDLDAWREGQTGVPIVDAGMRQLLHEGWMHNRARMVVASFLCKDLLVDWRLGEAHFLRHLVDGDVASNNLGWQWAAGTGTDAQPFFRIFNPVSQGTRHDPEGRYVRRHVPELAAVPDRFIHRPWEMPPAVQESCGVRIGEDYPLPIVDHAQAREDALAWFAAHRR